MAAAALTLSMTGAVMADTGDTEVSLDNGAPCTTGTVTGDTIDFGTWTWDGTAYTTSDTPTGSLVIPVANGVYGVTACTVGITVNDLTADAPNTDEIPGSAVTLTDGDTNTVADGSGNITVPQNASVTLTATLDLSGVSVQPDTYTGDITVGAATAAP